MNHSIDLLKEAQRLRAMLRRCCESYHAVPNHNGTKALGFELSTFLDMDEWIEIVNASGLNWPREDC